jgi:hypothetical protein
MCYLLALRTSFAVAFRTLRFLPFNSIQIHECKAFVVVAICTIFRVPFKFLFQVVSHYLMTQKLNGKFK